MKMNTEKHNLILILMLMFLSTLITIQYGGIIQSNVTLRTTSSDYDISEFNVTITVHENNTLSVKEVIKVRFINPELNVFIRPIYFEGFEDLKFNEVTSPDVEVTSYEVHSTLNLKELYIYHKRNPLQIHATFIIKYTAYKVLTIEDSDKNKLVWPIVGTGWKVPFKNIYATVILPRIYLDTSLIKCDPQPYKIEYGKSVTRIIFLKDFLSSRDEFYITIIFPKITEDVREYFIFKDRPVESALMIFLFSTLIMLGLYYFKGRIPTVEVIGGLGYSSRPPSKLKPAEASYILNHGFNPGQILSTLIDLARSEDIILEYDGFNLNFIETIESKIYSKVKVTLKNYEKELIDLAYKSGNSYKLLTKNWRKVRKIGKTIEKELVQQGYFKIGPSTLRRIFLVAGLIISSIGGLMIILAGVPILHEGLVKIARKFLGLFLGMIISGMSITLIGYKKFTSYTEKGARELALWRNYLQHILNIARSESSTSIPEKTFEEQLIYLIALAPQYFYDWAKSLRNKIQYTPTWLMIKGIESKTPEEKFNTFINVLGVIVKDFIEPFVHLRYLKWIPYPW